MHVYATPDIYIRFVGPIRVVLRRSRVKGRQRGARPRRARILDAVKAVLRCPQGTGGAATASGIARVSRHNRANLAACPIPTPRRTILRVRDGAGLAVRFGGVLPGFVLDEDARRIQRQPVMGVAVAGPRSIRLRRTEPAGGLGPLGDDR